MSAGEELGTVAYAPAWWVLAVGLLVLVVAWNAGVLLWGRDRTRRDPRPVRRRRVPRSEYLARIDELEADHARGALSARQAHQRLGRLVRESAEQESGVRVTAMTLRELEDANLPGSSGAAGLAGLAGLVRLLYPPAFAPPPTGADVARAADRARALVGGR